MLCKLLLYNKVNQLCVYHTLEKEVANHSGILAWEIPWTEEPGRLQSMGSHSQTQLKRLSSSSSRINVRALKIDFIFQGTKSSKIQRK